MDAFRGAQKRYLAFLFTDQNIKVAKLNKRGDSLELFYEFPLSEQTIQNGQIKDSVQLLSVLEQIKSQLKIDDASVIVGISEVKAFVHTLTLPDIELSEIDQAIKFQADTFLPISYQKLYLDWMLTKKKENKLNIVVSAVPKKIINAFTKILIKAGLKPVAFESTAISLFRLLPKENQKLSFVAEIDEISTVLVLGSKTSIKACSVVGKNNHFMDTIQEMKNFYLKKRKQNPPKIYLCGKKCSDSLLKEIKEKLNLETILLSNKIKNIPSNRESELAVLISLAQKNVTLPEDTKTINILPYSLSQKYKNLSKDRLINSFSLFFIVSVSFLSFFLLFLYFNCQNKNKNLKENLDPVYSSVTASIDKFSFYKNKISLVNQISDQNNLLIQTIKEFLASSFDNIEITGINFDSAKKEFIFTGRAKTRLDLLKLKETLEEKDFINQVTLPVSSLEKASQVEFRMKLVLKTL
ncbi:pilus assembly protein PilM [Patescibacteria group bacterium]|nr:pilus assembly protein PilM [Patescibacteria group bacterium]MCG2702242.1 pilus assembly protein PilM [Candidatus Parcubacteria bacterium]MBU4264744.1 pilus assembly protein PilM [Patescibacteria group bacterium]MBU4390082.1 pilus assembly protein PilM [Patescibacteria group bacterium]MBU4397295.1 pilus assembly protein PilM [Patescibacteria group bacterium]